MSTASHFPSGESCAPNIFGLAKKSLGGMRGGAANAEEMLRTTRSSVQSVVIGVLVNQCFRRRSTGRAGMEDPLEKVSSVRCGCRRSQHAAGHFRDGLFDARCGE